MTSWQSWIPDHVQDFCTENNLINPTPIEGEWAAYNDATKRWVDVPKEEEPDDGWGCNPDSPPFNIESFL